MAGEIALTVSLNRAMYQVMPTPQQAYVLIEAMPTAAAPAATAPVNFSLVLDRSGSMAGDKLRNMQAAAKMVVDRLGPQDMVSVVIFDEKADVVVPSQAVTNRDGLKRQIDAIQERGGTHMSSGMQAGLAELQRGLAPGRVSRMLLLTDGQTWEDQPQCEALADQARSLGVPLSVLGMGVGEESNWDPRFLENLAQRSGGEWYVIDAPEKVSAVFEKTLTAMQGTAVSNASLTLRLAADVKPRNVWRVVPLISRLDHHAVSERDIQVFLGDIQHGIGQSLLAEVLLPGERPAGTYRLIQGDITYDVPATNQTTQRVSVDVLITYTQDAAQANQLNPRVMNVVERVVVHKLQTQALDEAAMGQKQKATQRLRAAATRLLELGEVEMAQNAMQQAQQMEQGAALDPAAAQQLRYQTKKLTQNLSDLQNPS
jgi:Ca-activated chloride channel family protein